MICGAFHSDVELVACKMPAKKAAPKASTTVDPKNDSPPLSWPAPSHCVGPAAVLPDPEIEAAIANPECRGGVVS